MTNQEAIVHIKDVICENNAIKPNIVVFEQEKEALYMAIKALENQKSIVEELEKIKAEIEEYRNCIPWDKECLIKFETINYIYENIIWKHISELKGETHVES